MRTSSKAIREAFSVCIIMSHPWKQQLIRHNQTAILQISSWHLGAYGSPSS